MTIAGMFGITAKAALDAVLTGTPRVFLVKEATTTPNLATHDFYDDLKTACAGNAGSTTRGNGAEITNPTTTGGVFDGDDTILQNVPAETYNGILVINDDGSADATSRLLSYTNDATSGLPITTDGRDVKITWDSGTAKIFNL